MVHAAPKESLLKNNRNKYGDDPRLKRILDEQPESLKLFGLDVEDVKNEFDRAEQAAKEIGDRFDERILTNKKTWIKWVSEYRNVLA